MSDTVFSDATGTPIVASWLNDVNKTSYRREVNVTYGAFGAVGDGVTDDAAAIQAAVDYAESLIVSTGSFTDFGVDVVLPSDNYLVGTPITITKHGIRVRGTGGGRGTRIISSGTIFDIGDYTDTTRIRMNEISNLMLACTDAASTSPAIKCYRTISTNITCTFVGWYIGVDCYRASEAVLRNNRWVNTGRSSNALAFLRAQGTDETDTTGETYTPGGGFHVSDLEFQGVGTPNTVYTENVFLLMSVDGFYLSQSHMTGYRYGLHLAPDASPENRVIIDVWVGSNVYFDQPVSSAGTRLVYVEGTVDPTITTASGGTSRSMYSGIHVHNCYLRGANVADRCFMVAITDAGGAFYAAGYRVFDVSVMNNSITGSRISAIQFNGAAQGDFFEVQGARVEGNYTGSNNSTATAGTGSFLLAQCSSISVANNVGGIDAGSSTYIMSIGSTVVSTDIDKPSVVVHNNNFPHTDYLTKPLNITNQIGMRVSVAGNVWRNSGQQYSQPETLKTTDATPTVVWSYTVPEGQAGDGSVRLVASDATGARYVDYTWTFGYKRTVAGNVVLDGGAFTAGRTYKDGTTPAPTLTLTGSGSNTITLTATGVAATDIQWFGHVDIVMSR